VALRRRRKAIEIPQWVLEDTGTPEVGRWLDWVKERYPDDVWWECFVTVISTPSPGRPPGGPVEG
jgi:hypothetical protein